MVTVYDNHGYSSYRKDQRFSCNFFMQLMTHPPTSLSLVHLSSKTCLSFSVSPKTKHRKNGKTQNSNFQTTTDVALEFQQKFEMAEFEKYYGTYRCAKEQDYEKFLTTMGVSWPMRKMATMFTREFEVCQLLSLVFLFLIT